MDPLHHVLVQDLAASGVARVAAGDVPVDIDVALLFRLLGEFGHDSFAVVRADRVGSSSGEAEDICPAARLLLNDILHYVEICPVGVGTGVDLAVFVGSSMNAHAVARVVFRADQVLIVLIGGRDKEGRENFVIIEYFEKLFGVSAGTVVKSQIDDLLGVRLRRFGRLSGSTSGSSACKRSCPRKQGDF